MAVPPVVDPITNLSNESSAVTKINQNAQRASDAIAKSLSTTDTTQNTMNVPLDMNNQRILNLPAPTASGDPIRLQDRDIIKGDTGSIGPKGDKGNDGVSSHELNILDFGAIDDNSTNNTVAVQAAIDQAFATGSTLLVTPTKGRTGVYRVGTLNWRNINLSIDEGSGFSNLDGSVYTGTVFNGTPALPGRFDPFRYKRGATVRSPRYKYTSFTTPDTVEEDTLVYNGETSYPYAVSGQDRMFTLTGQTAASSGSFASITAYTNVYNHSNGPGVVIQADATNGSQFLTNCSPSPTAVNANSPVGATNLFNPARITCDTPGLADNIFAESWDGGTIALGSGPNGTPIAWTGPTGRYAFRVVSGRSEVNPISFAVTCFGTASTGGAKGGMNFYNEITMRTNASDATKDQEGLGNALCISLTKQSPGNLRTKLHGGSAALNVSLRPDDQFYTNKSYAADDGVVIAGWSEPTTLNLSSGSNAAAGYGAFNALRIGGPRTAPYQKRGERSRFQVGALIQDYDVAISINTPNTQGTFSGNAITIADGAGSLSIGDYIVERRSQPPASATASGVTGQRAWDTNYEYRCVAPNRWRRIPFTSDWP